MKHEIIENIKKINHIDNIKSYLKSKKNENCYVLTEMKVFILDASLNILKIIELPWLDGRAICFYDVYYDGDDLKLIIVTTGSFDLALIIDEDNLCIIDSKPTK